MENETIVAVFDTSAHAAAAVSDLEAAGVPSSAITQHAGSAGASASTGAGSSSIAPGQEKGFWASLFGGEPDYGHDTAVYDRSLQGGSTVVTIQGSGAHTDKVLDILERHNPIDIDERAATYGVTSTTAAGVTGAAGAPGVAATGIAATGIAATGTPETLSLSEEQLVVGKRAVNRGTTRVRRYVVETPVEEQVSLHNESVTIERRPVTDGRAVTGADFSDKVIEVTETAEEAVVGKQAHVREEVVIRKDATDRTETVRDTVRREDVEIVKEPGLATTGAATNSTSTTGTAASAPYKPAI